MELPEALRAAITSIGERQPRHALERAATSLSEGYRVAGDTTRALDSAASLAAYAVTRLPATFAALTAALSEARALLPDWEPTTLLDAGAGPAVSTWAASAVWPSLTQATLLERDQRMLELGRELLDAAPAPMDVHWRNVDMTGPWGKPASGSLVICAYALNEVPEAKRASLVERLWAATEPDTGALALVAPGTPAGFAAIRAARDQVIAAGGRLIAPCPHAGPCPMGPGDWCHMAQRLARSRLHRQLKGGDAPFEEREVLIYRRRAPTWAAYRRARHSPSRDPSRSHRAGAMRARWVGAARDHTVAPRGVPPGARCALGLSLATRNAWRGIVAARG